MATLHFNLHGYEFQEGAKTLLTSFQSAAGALKADVQRAEAAAQDYQKSLAEGGPWEGERDAEEGYVIWDQEDVLEARIEATGEALMGLRKAFVIAFYHHWERAIRVTTYDDVADHKRLEASQLRRASPLIQSSTQSVIWSIR
ncbi:hypothetical protein [Mesorhizobium cantuariense]|uniref:Uncharacterized protein n=1 Tax=Mesorhizobium cantuariense TaxID=1300275 RepID=A0ABV7MNU2_9HYPH